MPNRKRKLEEERIRQKAEEKRRMQLEKERKEHDEIFQRVLEKDKKNFEPMVLAIISVGIVIASIILAIIVSKMFLFGLLAPLVIPLVYYGLKAIFYIIAEGIELLVAEIKNILAPQLDNSMTTSRKNVATNYPDEDIQQSNSLQSLNQSRQGEPLPVQGAPEEGEKIIPVFTVNEKQEEKSVDQSEKHSSP
jgi:hypothetical protein